MFDKHAVWCQCASVVPFTMALSSLLSCQWMTIQMDTYWTCVLCITACIQFLSAEHANFVFKTDTWQQARLSWKFTTHVIFIMWTLSQWQLYNSYFCFPFTLSRKILTQTWALHFCHYRRVSDCGATQTPRHLTSFFVEFVEQKQSRK